ncbi:MAG: hypothetical protein ACFE88_05145 [Candidatus Hermodarchaeota archaeon]
MKNRELLWGFIFLFSAIFIIYISIWKFFVYLEISFILLFKIWEYIFFLYALIITSVALAAMVRSFYYFRKDLTEEKTVKWYIKVMVVVSVLYYLYNIYIVIDVILRW